MRKTMNLNALFKNSGQGIQSLINTNTH